MRSLLLSAAILATVVALVICSNVYLTNVFSGLQTEVGSVSAADVQDLYDEWLSKRPAVLLTFDKRDTDKIDQLFLKMMQSSEDKEFSSARDELLYELRHAKEKIKPKFENIF